LYLVGFLVAALIAMLLPMRAEAALLIGAVPVAALVAWAYSEPDPRGEGVRTFR
jgi:hypothetical protein